MSTSSRILTDEEFLATNTGLSDINVTSPSVTMLPWNWNVSRVGESKDWRKEGVVTPVKKQGGCGKLARITYYNKSLRIGKNVVNVFISNLMS